MAIVFVLILNLFITIKASIINCNTTTNCQNSTINCSPNEDCTVSCDGLTSCSKSVINCPLIGDCNIECSGSNSCNDATVNALLSTGNFNIDCQSTNACRYITIYGSMQENPNPTQGQNNQFNVNCNKNQRSCADSTINCPKHSDCTVSCKSRNSCKSALIVSPEQNDLTVNCLNDQSCLETIIDGKDSSQLHINGCSQTQSCSELSVYCPENTNGQKNCHIEGMAIL